MSDRGRPLALIPEAPTGPSASELDLSADIEQLYEDERLAEYERAAFSENTVRAHRADWDSFTGWCLDRGFVPLPAAPKTVARYLRWLIDRPTSEGEQTYTLTGRDGSARRLTRSHKTQPARPQTLRRHLVTIAMMHRAQGFESPTKDLVVERVWRGIRRKRGIAPTQKAALTREDLIKGLVALDRADAPLLALRDRAVTLLGWTGAFRRSEIAAIDIEDLVFDKHGLEVVLRRSKTNQEGEHESVLLPFAGDTQFCAASAVRAWCDAAAITGGPLFRRITRYGTVLAERMAAKHVAQLAKRVAAAAGLDPAQVAAHSLRAGWITTAAREERSERDIMDHTRHRSIAVMRGYIRRATKWERHAGLGLL